MDFLLKDKVEFILHTCISIVQIREQRGRLWKFGYLRQVRPLTPVLQFKIWKEWLKSWHIAKQIHRQMHL